MQTTFLWFRSNATGLYFDILDNIELIIYTMIILTTIITCFLLLLTNELKKVIKEFLLGVLSIVLPIALIYDVRYVLISPMRDVIWYHITHGAAIIIIPCLIPMIVFFPYSILMTITVVKKIVKKHKQNTA